MPLRLSCLFAAAVFYAAAGNAIALDPDTEDAIAFFEAGYWNAGYGKARSGADRNNETLQFWMGHCLENGLGGAVRDVYRAKTWYEKSAAQGNEKAKAALARLNENAEKEKVEAELKRREAEAAAEAERKRKEAEAAAEAERKRREAEAAAEAERKRKEAEAAAEAERKRKEAEAARILEEAKKKAAAIVAEAERIAAEREKAKKPGYRFDESAGKAIWSPGKAHPSYPHVVASNTEENWRPESGWEWVDKENSWEVRNIAERKRQEEQRRRKAITFPAGFGEQEKMIVAAGIMLAAVSDMDNPMPVQNQIGVRKLAMETVAYGQASFQDRLAFKLKLIEICQQTGGTYPDLAKNFDMDTQRIAIFCEMMESIVGDCADLEDRLNTITRILDNQGSRTHRVGNLGELWKKLRSGEMKLNPQIGRATPKFA